MAFLKFHKSNVDVAETPAGDEKHGHASDSEADLTGNRLNNGEVQSGVRRIEATTEIWSTIHLVTAYAM